MTDFDQHLIIRRNLVELNSYVYTILLFGMHTCAAEDTGEDTGGGWPVRWAGERESRRRSPMMATAAEQLPKDARAVGGECRRHLRSCQRMAGAGGG